MPDELVCRFCGEVFTDKRKFRGHERFCPRNPNRVRHKGKKDSAQETPTTQTPTTQTPTTQTPTTQTPPAKTPLPKIKPQILNSVLPLLQQLGIKDGATFSKTVDGIAREMPFYSELSQKIAILTDTVRGMPNIIFSRLKQGTQPQTQQTQQTQQIPQTQQTQITPQTQQVPQQPGSDDRLAGWFDRGFRLLQMAGGAGNPAPQVKYKELFEPFKEVIEIIQKLQPPQTDRGKELREDLKLFTEIAKMLGGKKAPEIVSPPPATPPPATPPPATPPPATSEELPG